MERHLGNEVIETLREDYSLSKRQITMLQKGLNCYEGIRDEEYDDIGLLLGEQYSSQIEIRNRNSDSRNNSAWETVDDLVSKTVEKYYENSNIKSPQKILKKV